MKTYRFIPAALAASLIAVGGASSALAASTSYQGQFVSPQTLDVTSTLRQGDNWHPRTAVAVSFDKARNQAQQKFGGEVVKSGWYGPDNAQYEFLIKSGNQAKRVFVNGHTGKMTVAASLDPSFDPAVIGTGQKNADS